MYEKDLNIPSPDALGTNGNRPVISKEQGAEFSDHVLMSVTVNPNSNPHPNPFDEATIF